MIRVVNATECDHVMLWMMLLMLFYAYVDDNGDAADDVDVAVDAITLL